MFARTALTTTLYQWVAACKPALTVWDWHDLNVRANLVVFSSCLSAFSKTASSGQSLGFSSAILSTGTNAFIGSLWLVDDKMTFLFMFISYQRLLSGCEPASALFEAQESFRTVDSAKLRDFVHALQDTKTELSLEVTSEYVSDVSRVIENIEAIDLDDLNNPAHWASFILVGHGFRPIGYKCMNDQL